MNNKNKKKEDTEKKRIDPADAKTRRDIARKSVKRTIEEYGEVLKMLGAD
jgi:hypothetical protein